MQAKFATDLSEARTTHASDRKNLEESHKAALEQASGVIAAAQSEIASSLERAVKAETHVQVVNTQLAVIPVSKPVTSHYGIICIAGPAEDI